MAAPTAQPTVSPMVAGTLRLFESGVLDGPLLAVALAVEVELPLGGQIACCSRIS